jgi:hypothetical protein
MDEFDVTQRGGALGQSGQKHGRRAGSAAHVNAVA